MPINPLKITAPRPAIIPTSTASNQSRGWLIGLLDDTALFIFEVVPGVLRVDAVSEILRGISRQALRIPMRLCSPQNRIRLVARYYSLPLLHGRVK
jgi:hypothetical protein